MEELIQKAKNGDKEAFTTIMLSLEKDLYKIAKTRLKNDDDGVRIDIWTHLMRECIMKLCTPI